MAVPIVLLPGIMGSRLYFPNSDRHWDPDSTLRMLWWVPVPFVNSSESLARALHRDEPAVVLDEEPDGLTPGEQGHGWGGVASDFYLPFLRDLHRRVSVGNPPAQVHALGYDWRQDILSLGRDVRDRLLVLLARERADRLILVTHSMGGLVVRSALKQFPELAERVAGVIHVCQPTLGAVVMYRRFFTGAVLGLDGGLGDLPFLWILGDDPAAYALNVCGLPGAMQLLPTPAYEHPPGQRWLPFTQPPNLLDLYGFASRPPGLTAMEGSEYVRENLAARYTEVRAYHATIGRFRHPNTWVVFGTGLETDVAVGHENGAVFPVRFATGDGTVPVRSAAALFDGEQVEPDRLRPVTRLEHGSAMLHPRVQENVAEIVGRLLAGVGGQG